MRRPEKYIVIYEMDNGYMDCVGICDTAAEAYGKAYLALCEGLVSDAYYITLPDMREGDNGCVLECRNKSDGRVLHWATVLFYYGDEPEEAET